MAKGRFISKEICFDKKVNELSCFESMLAFTWLIPHLDKEGLTYGDPAIVRSMIFPRRSDISVDQIEGFIQEWSKCGLIYLYEQKGDRYICFPSFDKHQVGLNKDREATSSIPLPDDYMSNAGINQEEITVKLIKDKLIKSELKVNDNNNTSPPADTFDVFADLPKESPTNRKYLEGIRSTFGMGFRNKTQIKKLFQLRDIYGEPMVLEVCDWAATKGMTIGDAIPAMVKALPNWNKTRASPGGNGKKSIIEIIDEEIANGNQQ